MITLRIIHAKNQLPRPKTVAYRARTHTQTHMSFFTAFKGYALKPDVDFLISTKYLGAKIFIV